MSPRNLQCTCVCIRLPCFAVLLETDHSNRVNKAIHLLCIWPILWTGLALMSQYSFGKLPPGVLEQLPLRDEAWGLHLGSVLSVVYISLYLGKMR